MRLHATRRAAIAQARGLGNPLWDLAGVPPSLDLRFAESKSLIDAVSGQQLITFSRASAGTFVNSAGQIETAAENVPRFTHDPVTLESLGLLVEEQRTNLLLRSEEFNNAYWTKINTVVTQDSILAPNELLTADKLAASSTSGNHRINRASSTLTQGLPVTASVYVRPAEYNKLDLGLTDFGGSLSEESGVVFDLQGAGSSYDAYGILDSWGILDAGNGWYRCWVTVTPDGVGTAPFTIYVLNAAGQYSYLGDGTSGIHIWGAQLEAGAFPTSYIPTTTATVTRSADVASDTTRGGNIRSLFTQFRSPASGTRPVVSLDDNTANERIEILTSGTDPKLLVTDSGSAVADLNGGTVTANVAARLAARFNTDDYGISVSGGTSQLDTSGTLPTVNRIRIGSNQAAGYLNGTIARITGWDTVLLNLPPITQ